MYFPFNEEDKEESVDVQPEYISKFNFTRKKQVAWLKISNGDRWHFLALKSEQEENTDCMKPTKSFSKLMRDKSSNSHENYYCFGCFHSFKCKSTLETVHNFVKIITFVKLNFLRKIKKIKEHKFGTKALRLNGIIYVDLECL